MYNLSIASTAGVPMFSPQQFTNVLPPSSISNLPGFQQSQPQVPQHKIEPGTFASIFAPATVPAQLQQQNVAFNPTAINATGYSQTPPTLQTYTTYPQQLQGTSVTTPISLPGMPPITVSATIPPQHEFPSYANAAPEQHVANQ